MNLSEIENLPFEELKGRRDELVAAAKQANVAELAARYVQARTDATLRDMTLQEQGRTIGTLNDALGAAKEANGKLSLGRDEANEIALRAVAKAKADAAQWDTEKQKLNREANQRIASHKAQVDELLARLASETARANRNAQLAARSEAAINKMAGILNELVAARLAETTNAGA